MEDDTEPMTDEDTTIDYDDAQTAEEAEEQIDTILAGHPAQGGDDDE